MTLSEEERQVQLAEIERLKKLCYRKMEDPNCKCMYCVLRKIAETTLDE